MLDPRPALLCLLLLLTPAAAPASDLEATATGIGSPESTVPGQPAGNPLHGTRTQAVIEQQLGLPPATHVLGIGGQEAGAVYQNYLQSIGSEPIGDTYRTQE